jgi:hypothetical protein
LHELEQEEALEAECEITDLDPPQNSNHTLNWWLHGQNLSWWTRLGMALVTILGVALLAWLVLSPLHLMGASHLEKASYGPIFTTSNQASPRYVQVLVVHNVIYLIDENGLVKAVWMRHKYVYLLWQHFAAPSSKLLKVDHNVVYLAAPDGSLIALRTSDGAVLWTKRGARYLPDTERS